MKFSELKQSLANTINQAYYLFGEDAFLRDSAQKMIEKHCVTQMPELNITVFNDENFELENCLSACQSLPFMDEKKVVVLNDISFDQKTSKELVKLLEKQNTSVCVVFKDSQNTPKNKAISQVCTLVDCCELDEQTILNLISFRLKKHNITIDTLAAKSLIEYCNANMTFVDQELKKFVAFKESGQNITQKDVQTITHKNIEYAVFELSNMVVEKNAQKSYELLELMLAQKEQPQHLLMMIVAVFRRMFYVATTKKTDAEIAKLLAVKEYAVKVARKTSKNYSPKKLKSILDLAGQLDFDIKAGRTNDVTALYQFVANCLLI